MIAVIDADLIGRVRHRFPNLAIMKIAAYYKAKGEDVVLKTDYEGLDAFDTVFVSKVFSDTPFDERILEGENVVYGGTGFFSERAPALPDEIEHHRPDYALYDDWIATEVRRGIGAAEFKDYTDASIGFLTRGCFRKCGFCVNRKYDRAVRHSPLEEFLDRGRKRIVLYDDNFLACAGWREILEDLKRSGKRFQFRQGLDLRLMTEDTARRFAGVKYHGDFIFAFDNIADRELIEDKLMIWKRNVSKKTKLYVFCAFDRTDRWNLDFWKQDIVDMFERIRVLMKFECLPYIMRFHRYEESPFRGLYITVARWCNQPSYYKKQSLREFVKADGKQYGHSNYAARRYLDEFEKACPEIAAKYFDMKFEEVEKWHI